jgi:hypothetical protein
MIPEKELTIKELKYIIKELEDDIDLYLTLKKINFQKTQPTVVKYKDVVSSKTNNIFDKFTHYVIKDEEYDETIYLKVQSLLAYQTRLADKIQNISQSSPKAYITYLREEENMSWLEIEKTTNFSERQARRIYKS